MIPVRDDLVDIDTLPGEEISFGIGDPRWVMKTQADLYSDITSAIIREYSTNAYDAHVMAGNSDPIEVTLPSVMNPFFIVEDKGTGMGVETFRKVYTQFGVSDKRDSNKTNGMLGYGSKSGIAYTTQFTVTSVKDGIKTQGIVKRKPDWAIVFKIVAQSKVNEPNGTRIEIPVHNINEFQAKAENFYRFWLPGRVKVNGKAPEHYAGRKVTDNFYLSTDNQSFVVMGNVPYRINNPSALFSNTDMKCVNFVAYVDTVGDGTDAQAAVEFTPSREDLKYTEHTKNTLAQVVKGFEKEVFAIAQKEISGASNHAEAYNVWRDWTAVLGTKMFDTLTFKGQVFKSIFDVRGTSYRTNNRYGSSTSLVHAWEVSAVEKTLFVTDCSVGVNTRQKALARAYLAANAPAINFVVFTPQSLKDFASPWVEYTCVTYDVLKTYAKKMTPISSGRYNPNAGRLPGSWDYYDSDGLLHKGKTIPDKADIILTVPQTSNVLGYSGSDIVKSFNEPGLIVIIVPQNRKKKLERDNPSIQTLRDYAKSKFVADFDSLLCEEGRVLCALDSINERWVNRIDHRKTDDPSFGELRRMIANKSTILKDYYANLDLTKIFHFSAHQGARMPKVDLTPTVRYPLLKAMTPFSVPEDTYIYLNAAYAERKEGK